MIRIIQLAALTAVAAAGVAWLDFQAFEVAVAMIGASAVVVAAELLLQRSGQEEPAEDEEPVVSEELRLWSRELTR